jgi:hypothetical protein
MSQEKNFVIQKARVSDLGCLYLSARELGAIEIRCFQEHEVPTVFSLPIYVLVLV